MYPAPPQLLPRECGQSRGDVIIVPTGGPPAHKSPVANARRILLGVGIGVAEEDSVEQVRQAQHVAVFVGDDAAGFGERAPPLYRALVWQDADCLSRDAHVVGDEDVVGDEGAVETQRRDPRGTAEQEPFRRGVDDEEHGIDDTVVVAGIRQPVGSVVVEP